MGAPERAYAATPWRGLLLVCLAGVLWGTIGPAVQLVHQGSDLSPWTIGAYRSVVALASLVLASAATRRLGRCRELFRAHRGRVVAVGLMTASFQLLFFVAVLAIGVSVATVVTLGLPPLLLLVVVSVERRRTPSRGSVATVAVAVVGLLLVSLAGSPGGIDGSAGLVGVLAALGSGAAYALSAHVGAPLSQRYDALSITTATMTVAAAALVPVGVVAGVVAHEGPGDVEPSSWLLLVYLGVVTMNVAYVLLFAGLRTTPSGSAVVATLLEPVTAVLIAVLALGETLTAAGVAGSLLIVAAIGSLGRGGDDPQPQ